MKHPTFFPIYSIHSDLVKTALGLKDNRSVEQFFKVAGIKIHQLGNKKVITCEDLLNVTTKVNAAASTYEPRSDMARGLDDMFT